MKTVCLSLVVLMGLCLSCKKGVTNSPGNGGNNGGNGGGSNGGGNDTLSVVGYSPSFPYTTDEITITGTGFNADKTKDSVLVTYPGNGTGNFAAIQSATTTQLKIVVPADSTMQLFYLTFPTYTFDISANGKHLQLGLDKTPIFKPALQLFSLSGQQNDGSIRPGDTVFIAGTGFTPSGNTLSIGGQSLNLFRVDTALGELSNNQIRYEESSKSYGFAAIPKTFFGNANDETLKKNQAVVFSNGDGKSLQKQDSFYVSPVMKVNMLYFETTFTPGYGYSYSLSSLNNSGGKIRLHIIGKNLKDNTDLEFTGFDANNNVVSDVHSSLGVTGFPDSTVVEYGTSGLQAGLNYIVRIWANNVGTNFFYGSQTFLLKQ